jgi:hypothetical protein
LSTDWAPDAQVTLMINRLVSFRRAVPRSALLGLLLLLCTCLADREPPSAHRRWFSLVLRVSFSAGQVLGPAVGTLLALLAA